MLMLHPVWLTPGMIRRLQRKSGTNKRILKKHRYLDLGHLLVSCPNLTITDCALLAYIAASYR